VIDPAAPSVPAIRVGIAGLGRSGWRNHLLPLTELRALYQVVAVTDVDPARVREAQQLAGCRAAADVPALVADAEVELVVVSTPSHLHGEHGRAALAAGKAVVCEKPMAPSLAEAERMLACAAEARRLLTVFNNRRYEPDFLQIRSVIAGGRLGEILSIQLSAHRFVRRLDWQAWLALGGGALRNTAWHLLDQALQLAGGRLEHPQITAKLAHALGPGDGEDYVRVALTAPAAPFVSIEVSDVCPYPQPAWLIMGSHGMLTGSHEELSWRYVRPGDVTPLNAPDRPPPLRDYPVDRLMPREKAWRRPASAASPSLGFYQDLHAAVRRGGPAPVTPAEIRQIQRIIDKCLRQRNT
jgi:scyllo-inositol 2-dehydrogenase (NADP+)